MKHKKSIKLFIAFLLAFFVAGICIGIYSISYSVSNDLDTIDLPPQTKAMLGIIVLLVFDPILFIICRYAKQEHVKILWIVALVLLVFISVCVLSEVLPLQYFNKTKSLTNGKSFPV